MVVEKFSRAGRGPQHRPPAHPLLQTGTSPWPVRYLAAQQEVSCRARKGSFIAIHHHKYHHLNYPLPPLPLSSIRPVPGSKKVGDHSSRETKRQQTKTLTVRKFYLLTQQPKQVVNTI